MSSPNHFTSGIENAFSSNFPNFIPASPDYVPASPGNTYSSSYNSFGVVPIASPTLSLFHDDPYMKDYYHQRNEVIHPHLLLPYLKTLRYEKALKKQMGNNHKISLARFRITDLEHIINDIQIRHQEDKESLLNAINELKISQEGPSDY
ncbi:hypothetical protein Tco_0335360 [Tanacetum coccineum]